MTKGCYAEGRDGYCEYASKQAFIIQNQYRVEKGVVPLVWSKELYNVAKIRSKELTKLFSHRRPDGTYCYTAFTHFFGKERCKHFSNVYSERLKSIGYSYVVCADNCYAENAAGGSMGPEEVIKGWRNSPGHYRTFIDSELISGSISCYITSDGTKYWISSFAYIDVDNVK